MKRELLARPSHEVAPDLIGLHLTSKTPEGIVSVLLTEVEAYEGAADPASHAYRGTTLRNEVMFGQAGNAYVYRSHGLHWCLNCVTGVEGTASGVLLRAGRVIEGEVLAQARRGEHIPFDRLARGPGCLGQALGVTGADCGTDLIEGPRLRLSRGLETIEQIAAGPRVGVRLAPDVPWRFWLAGDPSVSAYRRSPLAAPVAQ